MQVVSDNEIGEQTVKDRLLQVQDKFCNGVPNSNKSMEDSKGEVILDISFDKELTEVKENKKT